MLLLRRTDSVSCADQCLLFGRLVRGDGIRSVRPASRCRQGSNVIEFTTLPSSAWSCSCPWHVIRVDHQAAALDVEDPQPVDLAWTQLVSIRSARSITCPALEPTVRVVGALIAVRELSVRGD